MKTWRISAILCLAVFLTPSRLSAQPETEQILAGWRADIKLQDERLRRQEWSRVAHDARALVKKMVDGMLAGDGAARLLALAVAQQAVAESGLGHQAEAVWLWHLAQNLDPDYRKVTLGAYGPAGKALGRFRLRSPGEAPLGGSPLPAAGSFEPPRVIRKDEPRTPSGLARARIVADVEVEVLVTPEGQAVEPVLLTKPDYPSLAFVILMSLRGWRFTPAQAAGGAVPALFRTRVSHPGLQAAAARDDEPSPDALRAEEVVLKGRLADLDARLRRGEWQAVHGPALELVSGLRESGPETGLLAGGLRALALAEAGLGRTEEAVWHWQVAQNLHSSPELDLAPFGEAGRLLAQSTLRQPDEPPTGLEVVAATALGAGSTPPRKIAGEDMSTTGVLASPRIARWVRVQVVVDADGRVVAPIVRSGPSNTARWAALEAVRSWRFEPARKDGKPIAVFLDLTLPTRNIAPLAQIVPLTGDLRHLHELLLEQQWAKARGKASRLVWSLAEAGDDDPARAAAALTLHALAEAGSGDPISVCYWHAAQSFDGDLYHADLTAYGTAGAFLEASNPWVKPFQEMIPPPGQPSTDGGVERPEVKRPEKISGPAPDYTFAAREAGVAGIVISEAILGEDGRVYQPKVLKSLPFGLDLRTLSTLCQWRFKPALYQGKPVKVYYTLTTNYRVE